MTNQDSRLRETKEVDKGKISPDNRSSLVENPFLTITFASILEDQGCYEEAKKVYEAILIKYPAKWDVVLRRLERLNGLIAR